MAGMAKPRLLSSSSPSTLRPPRDQAEPAAFHVGQEGAAVPLVERHLQLDQAAERPGAVLHPAVQAGDVPPTHRGAQAVGVADQEDGRPQDRRPGGRADRADVVGLDPQEGQTGLLVGRHPADRVPVARRVPGHDRLAVSPLGRLDPDRDHVPLLADHHAGGHPSTARRVARVVLQRDGRVLGLLDRQQALAILPVLRRGLDGRRGGPWARGGATRSRSPARGRSAAGRPAPGPGPGASGRAATRVW